MFLGKIVVKNNYEKKGDLVFRPLIRAYLNNGFDAFVKDDKAFLLGIVNNDVFYELFTWKAIPYSDYEIIDISEFDKILRDMPLEKARILKKMINNFVFDKRDESFYDPEALIENAKDRAVEFDAFNRNLTDINPYQEHLNGYSDFSYKCKVLEKNRGML